nr:hypothetical protein [Tanacetum cinerariifolium]
VLTQALKKSRSSCASSNRTSNSPVLCLTVVSSFVTLWSTPSKVVGAISIKVSTISSHVSVGKKMHKAFPLLGESSHWQYKFPLPVEGVPTARSLHCYDEETASQRELAVTLRRWLMSCP